MNEKISKKENKKTYKILLIIWITCAILIQLFSFKFDMYYQLLLLLNLINVFFIYFIFKTLKMIQILPDKYKDGHYITSKNLKYTLILALSICFILSYLLSYKFHVFYQILILLCLFNTYCIYLILKILKAKLINENDIKKD